MGDSTEQSTASRAFPRFANHLCYLCAQPVRPIAPHDPDPQCLSDLVERAPVRRGRAQTECVRHLGVRG
jgi:hypothetical protein